jgi:hypothetical protein
MSNPLRDIHRELQFHQRRLGTAAEQPGDFERVLEIAHAINNRLTALLLAEAMDGQDQTSLGAANRKHLR